MGVDAGQRMVLELWEEDVAPPMHALHMGFGIGALIVPMIANPFLAKLADNNAVATNNSIGLHSKNSTIILEKSRIHYAYLIVSAISICIALPFFFYQYQHIRKRKLNQYRRLYSDGSQDSRKTRSFKEMINPASYAGGSCCYGTWMLVLLFLFYFSTVGGDVLFGTFIRSFSVDELNFDNDSASYLNMLFWASFAIGRFTGSITSKFINIRNLLALEIILNLISVTILDLYSTRSKTSLWVFTAINGLCMAPLYPTGISYGNSQIEITGIWVTMITLAGSLGDIVYTWLGGHVYSDFGPHAVLYVLQFEAVCIFAIVMAMVFLGCSRKSRFAMETEIERADVETVNISGDDKEEETAFNN